MGALSVEWRGDVAVVRWDDGENRLNLASVGEWHDLLSSLEAHDGPLAVVLTGTGKFFSNGLDLDWMSANGHLAAQVVERVHLLLGRLLTLPAYVVGAVSGHAFACGKAAETIVHCGDSLHRPCSTSSFTPSSRGAAPMSAGTTAG